MATKICNSGCKCMLRTIIEYSTFFCCFHTYIQTQICRRRQILIIFRLTKMPSSITSKMRRCERVVCCISTSQRSYICTFRLTDLNRSRSIVGISSRYLNSYILIKVCRLRPHIIFPRTTQRISTLIYNYVIRFCLRLIFVGFFLMEGNIARTCIASGNDLCSRIISNQVTTIIQ